MAGQSDERSESSWVVLKAVKLVAALAVKKVELLAVLTAERLANERGHWWDTSMVDVLVEMLAAYLDDWTGGWLEKRMAA